jgi:predicted MFS family arabinose efflux permease
MSPGHGSGEFRAAVGLAMAPLVAVGLARFSYALLLPAMRADLGWSYAEAGALNTANAAGYLAGAIVAAGIAARVGARRVFVAGLFVTALALIASAGADALVWHMVWRALAGAAGAIAFVAGAGLAVSLGQGGFAIATYFGGGGAGVLVSSLIVPPTLAGGWRFGWLAMGAAALAAVAFALWAVPANEAASAGPATRAHNPRPVPLAPTYLAYLCFGAGYIGYMTFIIALLRAGHVAPVLASAFWAVLGLASVTSCYGWGAVFTRLSPAGAMVAAMLVVAVGAALPLVSFAPVALFASAVLFGGAVMAMPGAVTVSAQAVLPAHQWTEAVGRLTALFGVGQCVGPIAAGYLADRGAGLETGLLASAGLLAVGAAAASFQRGGPSIADLGQIG